MTLESRFSRRRLIAVAGIAAVLGGGLVTGRVLAESARPVVAEAAPVSPNNDPAGEPGLDKEAVEPGLSAGPDFPVNENGQTFGVAADPNSPETAPDLVAVEMSDGRIGYVRSAELFRNSADKAESPEQVVRREKTIGESLITNEDGLEYIPLTAYESDGVTVVGTWEGLNDG